MRRRSSSRAETVERLPGTVQAVRIARNVVYNAAAQSWLLVLGLVAMPIAVRALGVELFGLYTLVLSLLGYLVLFDGGLGVATVKFVAEYHGRGDQSFVQRLVSASVGAYVVLAGVGAAAIALSAPLVVDLLDLSPEVADTARASLYVAAIGFLVTMPLAAFTAVPTALERMDITNRRAILFGTVNFAATVILLELGYGVVEIVAASVAVTAVAAGSLFAVSRRLLPSVSFRPRYDRRALVVLVRFGALKFVNQVATHTVYHLDKFLVGALASVTALGYYAVAVLIAQRLAALVGNVASAFLPAASALRGREDHDRFEQLYFRATKVITAAVLAVASLLFFFSFPILEFWLGAGFAENASIPLKILVAGYALNALTTIPAVASDSVNRPRVTTAFSVASTLVNVVLSVVLIPLFGIVGASAAILVNSALLLPPFLYYVHRRVLHLSLSALVSRSLARPLGAAVASWPVMLALASVADTVPRLVLGLFLSLAVFVSVTVLAGVYDAVDRHVVRVYLTRAAAVRS